MGIVANISKAKEEEFIYNSRMLRGGEQGVVEEPELA